MRQIDNDVQSIDEMLATLSVQQTRHLHRLNGLDEKLDGVEERLTGRLDGLETTFDGVTGTLAEVLRRLPDAG